MLIRLTYASTLALDCDLKCINDIVEWSALANQRRQITGILAVDGARVLQILEGPEAAVISLFEPIRRDDRHHGIVELDRSTISAPRFEAWGMVKHPMADALLMSQKL